MRHYGGSFTAILLVELLLHMVGAMSTGSAGTRVIQLEDDSLEAEPEIGTLPFTVSEQKELVYLHNRVRSAVNPHASNMAYISWDPYLQSIAQRWADGCLWEHGVPADVKGYYGQNLWAATIHDSHSMKAIVDRWADEVKFYDYTTNSCLPGKVCGHYTQVVWSSTNRVGCGRAFCPVLEGSSKDMWIVVCQYSPGGNLIGRQPYTSGPSCTQCSSGVGQCYQNVCRSCEDHSEECDCHQICHNCGEVNLDTCTCTCPDGYRGTDCSETCQDLHPSCGNNPGFPNARVCRYHPMIPRLCPLMCGVCLPPLGQVTCQEATTVATTAVKTTTELVETTTRVTSTTTGRITPPGEESSGDYAIEAEDLDTSARANVVFYEELEELDDF